MKRKVYVKQMKMLKKKSNSKDKEEEEESNVKESDTSSTPSMTSCSTDSSPNRATEETDHQPDSNSLPTTATTSVATVSNFTPTSSNSAPLPKVDVLMKGSSLRAFQLRPNQDPIQDIRNQASSFVKMDDTKVETFQPEVAAAGMSFVGHQPSGENVERNGNDWRETVVVEHRASLSPAPGQSPYRMDFSGPYSVDLNRVESAPTDTCNGPSSSESPVFHQLQASRVNEKSSISPDHGTHLTGYPENIPVEHRTGQDHHHHQQHHQYNYHVANPGIVQQQQQHHLSEVSRYSHDSSQHVALEEEALNRHHGQIRAWEQENYRYVDYTWRHQEHELGGEEPIYSAASTDDDSVHTSNTSNGYSTGNVLDESMDLSNKTMRQTSKGGGGSSTGRRRRKRVQTPVQRSAANMRERRRMCHLNVAFDYLKEHLPNVKDKKKLSRIQTLKAAIYYIHLLQDSLNAQ